MRKLIKERMANKVVNFVGLNKVVLGVMEYAVGKVARETVLPFVLYEG